MSGMQRRKGANGERELAGLLRELLGAAIKSARRWMEGAPHDA